MTELARLKFYATQPHPCSYLPEEQATTLFLDPSQPMDVLVYAELSEMGFRRSGDHLYRPHCQQCTACIPARIPAARFTPNRQQRRILKRNEDIVIRCVRPAFTEEYYDLYVGYIEQRHADGDMYPPSRDQFSTFLIRDLPFSRFYGFVCKADWSPSQSLTFCQTVCQRFIPSMTPPKNAAAWGDSPSSGKSARPSAWGWRPSTSATGSRIVGR